MGQIHFLKIDPAFFKEVKYGNKNFEVRKNDRHFELGDCLVLSEYDREKKEYTHNQLIRIITYILTNKEFEVIPEDYVILGFRPSPEDEWTRDEDLC